MGGIESGRANVCGIVGGEGGGWGGEMDLNARADGEFYSATKVEKKRKQVVTKFPYGQQAGNNFQAGHDFFLM